MDISQDFVIRQNKRYVPPSMLAEGDGPVANIVSGPNSFIAAPMLN